MTDPFSDNFDNADTEETETVTENVWENNVQQAPTGEISLTFKGDGGYHSPWIVLRAPNAAALNELLDEDLQELMKNSTKYAKAHFKLAAEIKGDAPAGGGSSNGGGQRQAPGPQEHPDGKKEFCQHGEMKFKSGVAGPKAKNPGKPYSMFVCQSGDRDNECKPKNA